MSIILPYYENLGVSDGAFITPDGQILSVDGDRHEEFAESYCYGRDFPILNGDAFGPSRVRVISTFEGADFLNEQPSVNVFQTSKLRRMQLEKYKLWLIRNHQNSKSIYSDFLVYYLLYDKVEKKLRNTITTSSFEPHVRFFNYYLMDWRIDYRNRLVYDADSDTFHVEKVSFAATDYEDREAEEEIREIKEKVLIKDRPIFFK